MHPVPNPGKVDPVASASFGFAEVRLRYITLGALGNRYNSSPSKYVLSVTPVKPFQQPTFHGDNLWVAALHDVCMENSAPAFVTEVTILLSSTVTHAREVGDVGIVINSKEGKECRGAEC